MPLALTLSHPPHQVRRAAAAAIPAALAAWPELRLWAAAPPTVAAWLAPAAPVAPAAAAKAAAAEAWPVPAAALDAAVGQDLAQGAPQGSPSLLGSPPSSDDAATGALVLARSALYVPLALDPSGRLLSVAVATEYRAQMSDAVGDVAPMPRRLRGVIDLATGEGLLFGTTPDGRAYVTWTAEAAGGVLLASQSLFARPRLGGGAATLLWCIRSIKQRYEGLGARPAAAAMSGLWTGRHQGRGVLHDALSVFLNTMTGSYGSSHVPSPLLDAPDGGDRGAMPARAPADGARDVAPAISCHRWPAAAAAVSRLTAVVAAAVHVRTRSVECKGSGDGGRRGPVWAAGSCAPLAGGSAAAAAAGVLPPAFAVVDGVDGGTAGGGGGMGGGVDRLWVAGAAGGGGVGGGHDDGDSSLVVHGGGVRPPLIGDPPPVGRRPRSRRPRLGATVVVAYQCRVCGNTFDRSYNRNVHMRKAHAVVRNGDAPAAAAAGGRGGGRARRGSGTAPLAAANALDTSSRTAPLRDTSPVPSSGGSGSGSGSGERDLDSSVTGGEKGEAGGQES
ncbi:hypothetical protein MMPV_006104 [Pyropia vietnamensis]